MDWMIWVTFMTLLVKIQAVSLNPFAAFADPQYEPVADYSIHRSVYLQNMPSAQIFPLAGESINGVVGIPSLQTPFANPLLQQQLFSAANQNVRTNIRNSQGANSGSVRDKVNNQQTTRGVTLDIRGGGYKVEPSRAQRPYNPPNSAGGSVRSTPQRQNNVRNANSGVNRKQTHRPRGGSTLQNPHYNGKFETSLSSVPSNVEFVNPENVLPMHPRIYKQFLQRNPQAAAYLRGQKQSLASTNQAGGVNTFDASKQNPSKLTRNRGISPNAQFASSSPYSSFQSNFQVPNVNQAGAQINGQYGLAAQTLPKTPTFQDFYNSDPQFYAAFSQTPEGKAVLSQMYQHFGPSANKPTSANQAPQNTVPKSNPFAQSLSDINSYSAASVAGGYGPGSGFPGQVAPQFANSFGTSGLPGGHFNKQVVPNYSEASQYNQHQLSRPQQQSIQQQPPTVQHQQVLRHPVPHQQQALQPQTLSHPSLQSNQHNQQLSNYGVGSSYAETPQQSGVRPESIKQHVKPESVRQQYGSYAEEYADDTSSFPGGLNYDPKTYQSPYQENYKGVDNSAASDPAGYTSHYSSVDPLVTTENSQVPAQNYYSYPSEESAPYRATSSRFPSTALHEISPSEAIKRPSETSSSFRPQSSRPLNSPGYWTPEQLFAPQSTGLQSDAPLAYSASAVSSSQASQDEQQDGSERAALHLPEDAPTWSESRPNQELPMPEYSEAASETDTENALDYTVVTSTERPDSAQSEEESDEQFRASIRDLQKLWTRLPTRSSTDPTRATTLIYRSTSAPEMRKTSVRDDLRNHRTTPSYTFQYSPVDKTSSSKSTTAWWSRKSDGSRYKIPPPLPNTTSTSTTPSTTSTRSTTPSTTSTSSTTTTTTTTTTATESPPPTFNYITTTFPSTSVATTTPPLHYQDSETPICALHNNLTYCLQDPEYPKDAIREAIERNRHPLDHFLVDISASSNVVDDQSLHSVFENSAPMQSTSVSYSFEGKVISPNAGEMLNTTGCTSNVYYAKPLRALNTAGLWKVIVNVEFEDTGANYTQTVRIEECTHPPGYVATCGVHSISACLQQYKLYRLLSWESHRGFYIDAFLLPVACFCGSQDS